MATTTSSLHQTLRCGCGQTKIAVDSPDVLRLVCYCKDCRGYYNALNERARTKGTQTEGATATAPSPSLRPAPLDAWGGCDYTHVIDAANIKVLEGQDHIAVQKIRDKSAIKRFYAGCCDTPLCSVGPSGTFLINTHLIDEAGRAPVRFRIIGRNALPSTTDDDDKNIGPRPPMSWSVPLSWFWTMSRRMPKDKTVPLPFSVPETIPVMDNFKQG